jgi:hypothetical protein
MTLKKSVANLPLPIAHKKEREKPMNTYRVTTIQNFELVTDDIRKVLEHYEFSVFDEGVIGEAEFIDGHVNYEVVSND